MRIAQVMILLHKVEELEGWRSSFPWAARSDPAVTPETPPFLHRTCPLQVSFRLSLRTQPDWPSSSSPCCRRWCTSAAVWAPPGSQVSPVTRAQTLWSPVWTSVLRWEHVGALGVHGRGGTWSPFGLQNINLTAAWRTDRKQQHSNQEGLEVIKVIKVSSVSPGCSGGWALCVHG